MSDFLSTVGDFITNTANNFANNVASNPYAIPAAAMAAQQFHNADQYRQAGNQAADRADPFGQYRRGYGDELANLYKDPTQIENTPGYKFSMNQTMNSTGAKLAAMGMSGSSQMQNALAQQSSGLAQQTWNTEADRLARLSGAQFDPANAARMQMEGNAQKLNAENQGMGALAWLANPGGGGNNNNNGRNNNSNGGTNPNFGGMNPQDVLNRLAQAAGPGGILPGGGTAAQLFQKWLSSPGDISQSDMNLMRSVGIDTSNIDGTMVDTAPPGYNYSGFGPDNSTNDSTGYIMNGNFDPTSSGNLNYNDVTGSNQDFFTDSGTDSPIDTSGFQIDPWG